MTKRIVILGGGYGGVLTAKKLEKQIRKRKLKDVTLTLIDKNPYHTMLTELHEVAAGRVEEDSIRIDLHKIFARRNVEIVLDEIISADFEKNTLTGKRGEYPYDYLVVGSGCKPAYYGVEGAEDMAFSLWSYEDAIRIREHVQDMFRNALNEADLEKRKEMLTFVVSGAGFTGVEMAGELAEWVPVLCERFGVDREETRIIICDMLPEILMSLPEKQIKKARKRLEKMGVGILTGESMTKITNDSAFLETTGRIGTRTVIWTCGVVGSDIVKSMDLKKQARDRVIVNAHLQSPDYKNVYIVGDNMFYIPEGEQNPVPQMVENCEHSAPLIAGNILVDITGKGEKKEYKPVFHGVMVCIGGRYGVAHIGGKKKKFGLPSFLAMFVKHFINVVYFVQIAGWNKVYSYLQHEIFSIRDNRSFVGGYFGKRSPNFWMLPLRMFVGIMWLLQGIEKLPKIFNDYRTIFLFPTTDAGTSATTSPSALVDGVTAATEAAEAWGPALPIPGFLQDIAEWMLRTFIEPIGPFFQASMVFMEVIVGLLLIGGLFTAPAATISVIMCIMIYMSGWAAPEILWYLFASIALIGGSGSTFGMDYYVLPWLKKLWRRIPFVRKWYLYND